MPTPLTVRPDAIPVSMRAAGRWLVWRYEQRTEKWTKVPHMASRTSQAASSTDPDTWSDFQTAVGSYEDGKADGIGFALGDGWFGVDLDHVVSAGAVSDVVRWTLTELGTYCELSVSGTGIHAIGRGVLPPGRRRVGDKEVYDAGRFFTVTGHRLLSLPEDVADCSAVLPRWYAKVFGVGKGRCGSKANGDSRRRRATLTDDDAAVLEKAKAAVNGAKFSALWAGDFSEFESQSEADAALCTMLAFWTGRNQARIDRLFRQSGLMRPKWDERRGAQTYGERTVSGAARHCSEEYGAYGRRGLVDVAEGGASRDEAAVGVRLAISTATCRCTSTSSPPRASYGRLPASTPESHLFPSSTERGTGSSTPKRHDRAR